MRNLFVCTKPYQYIIARLIVEGFNYKKNDIVILSHFKNSYEFAQNIRRINTWQKVIYINDDEIMKKVTGDMGLIQRFIFWNNWENIISGVNINYDDYINLFIAHDNIPIEYGLMRKFYKDKKDVYLFEEGWGNYVNINKHKSLKRLLKRISYLFNVPSDYYGKFKFVKKIFLQYPEIVIDNKLPIAKKVFKLPMRLIDFLNLDKIKNEFFLIYPELNKISNIIKDNEVHLILGEPFADNNIVDRLVSCVIGDSPNGVIIYKPHPGDKRKYKYDKNKENQILYMDQNIPIELISLVIPSRLKKLKIYSFGSTAIINLFMLLKDQLPIEMNLISEIDKLNKVQQKQIKNLESLLEQLNIKYKVYNI